MVGDDIQLLLDGLAHDLDASLALEDTDQRLLAHTDHATPIDDVRLASLLGRRATAEVRAWFEQWGIREADAPVRTPAGPEIGALARWCLPVRFRRTALGYVWILDDGAIGPDGLGDAAAVAAQIGVLLYRRQLAERADAELLRLLVVPHDADAAALADAYPHRGPFAVLATGRADGDDLERSTLAEAVVATRRAAEAFPPGSAIVAGIGGLVAAAIPLRAPDDLGPARRFAAAAIANATRQLRGLELAVGIGGVATAAGQASRAHAEARRALRVARAVPAFGPVAAWDELGVFRALALIPAEHVATGVLDARVRRLLDDRPELARTAEAFLDAAGDALAASGALGIHRATLYQRLGRIRETTGLDLVRSGDDRLVVHLGLRLARLAGVG